MRRTTVYLDTSVVSALFDERNPERKALTEEFWEKIQNYNIYLSEITKKEIEAASEALREKMTQLTEGFTILSITEEVEALAEDYIRNGVFPQKYRNDALHISVATVYGIAYLFSWNFKHMVKVRTRRVVNLVNELRGYPRVEILAPPEL